MMSFDLKNRPSDRNIDVYRNVNNTQKPVAVDLSLEYIQFIERSLVFLSLKMRSDRKIATGFPPSRGHFPDWMDRI